MYFEVIFKVILALFAVFGVYSLICIIAQSVFGGDNICVALEIRRMDDFFDLDLYLEDATSLCFLKNTGRVIILLDKELSENEEVVGAIKDKNLDFIIVDGKGNYDADRKRGKNKGK